MSLKFKRVWVIGSGPAGKPESESLPVQRRSTNSINQIPNSEFLGLVPVNASVFPFAINKNLEKIPNVFVTF